MSSETRSARGRLWLIVWLCLAGSGLQGSIAADTLTAQTDQEAVPARPSTADAATDKVPQMRAAAVRFLELTQREDGSWTSSDAVGITGLVTASLLRSGRTADDPLVSRGLTFLTSRQRPDGGIHAVGSRHQNYETCIAVLALSEVHGDAKYAAVIRQAENFLRGLQWDEGEGIESADGAYGGAGYDSKQRPDMSNTQFLVEALRQAGVAEDDPAMQKALIFISRSQNLESRHNTLAFAAKVNDGGFIYTPARGGESKAGLTDNGGYRSYGSITYAGLKSLIFAGLNRDDERVQAATGWIRRNYTLDENPGMGQQGLYYYYHSFAKTMSALGEDEFEDADGERHHWKSELISKLNSLQQANGSWSNPADRWYEGDPNLVTAYCLLALSHCTASDKPSP